MDRPIDNAVRKKRLIRRLLVPTVAVALAVGAILLILGWITPSVDQDDIRTAPATIGVVEETITASGNVVPEFEHVITSPIDTRVLRILKTPGDSLAPGEPIVALDVSESRLALDKLGDQIALKQNEQAQARQEMDSRIADLQGQDAIKQLELQSLEFEAERNRQYFDMGLFSQDDVRKSETDAERARIELRQLSDRMERARVDLVTRLEGLGLELSILEKDRDEAARRLDLATAASDRAGVLTWVVPSEGSAVRRGDELARMADLSAFRVEATVSDVHGQRIGPGLPVLVISADTRLTGRVTGVRPMVENGIITMDVELDDKQHAILRHNLRVEVYIVTSREANALVVPRGQYLNVEGVPMLFVVQGETAVRTAVSFGLKNFEQYQILEGLSPGDEVILSDMSEYRHVREVKIR